MNEFWPSVDKVADAIHNAGGIVVLAHPFNYKENVDVEKLLEIVIDKNIDGVEVYHPSCDKEKIKYLLDFAKRNNLIITGGSDYHGTAKHKDIGIVNIDEKQSEISL